MYMDLRLMQRDKFTALLTWIARGGYVLAALGFALLSPLVDLLPVEVEPLLRGDFRLSGNAHLYRVVTTSSAVVHPVPIAMAVVGVMLSVAPWLLRRWMVRR